MTKPQTQEFCLYCGAGIGMFRREGEGTCPKCDPIQPLGPPAEAQRERSRSK